MTPRHLVAIAACLGLAACTGESPQREADNAAPSPTLERAGQPVDPLKTAGRIAALRLSALTGDQDGVRRNMQAMSDDMRRAMKLPDPSRPIDAEAARAAVRDLDGVRSVVWLDHANLLVRPSGADRRTQQTIDAVCRALQPLGDTLAVVVHLQNADPRTRDDTDTLSRNCQLAPGDRAFLQRDRQVDVLDPALRARARADAERLRGQGSRKHDAGDRAALEAIPEM